MKINQLQFRYNSDKQEFIPIYKKWYKIPKKEKIYSIRLGQYNEKYIFINMKDFITHQLILNVFEESMTFNFQNETYVINKEELNNPLVTINKL